MSGPRAERFDAIVVGSGAAGGWVAKDLCEAGLRVALLEAGPAAEAARSDPARQPVQARCYAFDEATAPLFVDDLDNPYTTPEDAPFDWIRGRVVGGRMNTWGRTSVRMSETELKAASRDGIGIDWPLAYADLDPHYGRVERFLRVTGSADGIAALPDGTYLEPPPPTRAEALLARALAAATPARRLIGSRLATAPARATIDAAAATGRLTEVTGAVVARVLTEPGGGRARGVAYRDREGGAEHEVEAGVVVLCASAIESTRVLLNSADADHPDGLANASGQLGRNLFDHTYGIGLEGIAPQWQADRGARSSNGAILALPDAGAEGGFLRGYEIELQAHPPGGGLREQLRKLPRGEWGGRFWMSAFGEVLPNPDNRVTLDPERVDAWGIPAARIECRYGENERLMAADQLARMRELAELAGWRVEEESSALAPPGRSVHELGTVRMGHSAADSVLNSHCQSWEVTNLFVADGGAFTSGGFQNPTLTIMALASRAAARIVSESRRGGL
jgi:choline dehydrogenase-like flavoprotein